MIDDVEFISPLLSSEKPTLNTLRQAAARLHARLLLVYTVQDNTEEGYNDAALAYWTIIGMWVVPGNMVGYYSAAQALLIDTLSGQIVGVASAEAKHEEAVTAAAFDIAKNRAQTQTRAAVQQQLYENVRAKLVEIAR